MSRPLNGTKRKSYYRKYRQPLPSPPVNPEAPDPRYRLVNVESKPRPRHLPGTVRLPVALRHGPLFAGPGKKSFVQQPLLPAKRGRVAFTHLLRDPSRLTKDATIADQVFDFVDDNGKGENEWDPDWGIDREGIDEARHSKEKEAKKDRHARRRESQFRRWQDLIQSLVPLLLDIRRRTRGGRYTVDFESPTNTSIPPRCTCPRKVKLKVMKVRWDGFSNTTLTICDCATAPCQLLASGYFPCAPVRPTLAVDINLLELILFNFCYMAPNVTGWAETLTVFWRQRGYVLDAQDSLRRRLGNALSWFQALQEAVHAKVDSAIVRRDDSSDIMESHASVFNHTPSPSLEADRIPNSSSPVSLCRKRARSSDDGKSPTQKRTRHAQARHPLDPAVEIACSGTPGDRCHSLDSPASAPRHPHATQETIRSEESHTLTSPTEDRMLSVHSSSAGSGPSTVHRSSVAQEMIRGEKGSESIPSMEDGTLPRSRPSEHLRACCPACFGATRPVLAQSCSHAIVCLDANFSQKCRKANYRDPAYHHPQTLFVPPDEVAAMEAEVEAARSTSKKKAKDNVKSANDEETWTTNVPNSVLDECEKAFIAAQEKVVKASRDFYTDTGIMALLCRHDRAIWLVNLTTAGEKQYYALTLLARLFTHLPPDWNVGVLYDISCQIHRSIVKHSLLEKYHNRLIFAVSVFHAYGHQWPCQLIYHPRKCEGFGLSDGEGCERFWSALRRLIPSLRVSGHHRRLFVLDTQIRHMQRESLRTLGRWMNRKMRQCRERRQDCQRHLEKAMGKAAVTECNLRAEWKAQIEAQTQKLQRQSRKSADEAIERILNLRDDVARIRHDLIELKQEQNGIDVKDTIRRSTLQDEVDATEIQVALMKKKLAAAEKALGVKSRQRLEKLKGNGFLRLRMNARALKARIRACVINHKFEREKLERAYRHQIMQDKEQSQTKSVLQRTRKGVSTLVSRFNKIASEMEVLRDSGEAPRNSRLPRHLDVKKLFRLDVDDGIWDDDGLGGLDEEVVPRWLSDDNIREGIAALLGRDRCDEELERLRAEMTAMRHWVRNEVVDVQAALLRSQDNPALAYHLKERLRYLLDVSEHWRKVIQANGVGGDWLVPIDLPGGIITRAERHQGEVDPVELDVVSSDDSGSDSELETAVDENDNVDDIIENILEDNDAETHADDMEMASETGLNSSCHGYTTQAEADDPDDDQNPAPCEVARQCGLYWCNRADIDSVVTSTGWINGRAITLYVESVVLECGEARHADHLPAPLLLVVREYLDSQALGDVALQGKRLQTLASGVSQVEPPGTGRTWLLPVHVPSHWTMVALCWDLAEMRFYDSLPEREGAAGDERQARELVLGLLKVLVVHFGINLDISRWRWIPERRDTRQHNTHDCGVFVIADLESYVRKGCPSTAKQADMVKWRKRIADKLRSLPKRSVRWNSSEVVGREVLDEDGEVI